MRTLTSLFSIALLPLLLVTASCQHRPSYEEQKQDLGLTERKNPLLFLSTDGTYRQNFWGTFVVNGRIINSATVAMFKNATLEIKFYSPTESMISTENKTIYEYFPPGQTKDFNFKMSGPEGATKLGWTIISADAQ